MCCLHTLCSQMSFLTCLRVPLKTQGWTEVSLKLNPECDIFNKAECPGEDEVRQLYHAFQLFPW